MTDTSQTTSPTWKIEFENRIKAFSESIGLSLEKTKQVFEELGVDGQTEQSLNIVEHDDFLPISDLFEAFVDSGLTKKAKLRAGIPHLRGSTYLGNTSDTLNGNEKLVEAIQNIAEANKSLSSFSDEELLNRYDEENIEVARILSERTHGRYCIVLNEDESINKTISLDLIKTARKQKTSDRYSVNGKLVRLYRIGEFPAKPLDESPFFEGVALVNEYCSESNTNWSNISHEIRVLVRLQTNATKNITKLEMKRMWKDASSMSLEEFRKEYNEAAFIYDELQKKNELPKLKIKPEKKEHMDIPFMNKTRG